MRIKPLILLFFVGILWGGYIILSVNSQVRMSRAQRIKEKIQDQGEVLQWFFQERTLALKSLKDDEPYVSRYSKDEWESLSPWKGIAFLKNRSSHVYGPFEKMMPQAHREQLLKKLIEKQPPGALSGVHWDAFQWNGTPFVVAYVSRAYGSQVFLAQASDWGRSLSLLSSDSGWTLVNQAGTILFHSDIRYVGQKRPLKATQQQLVLSSTNLVATLATPQTALENGFLAQIIFVSLGFFVIAYVLISQLMKSEKLLSLQEATELKKTLQDQYLAQLQELDKKSKAFKPEAQKLFFKDLSHRVASSLGRQLQPAFISILGYSQWLMSVANARSEEEKSALSAIIRESRASKEILDKLLSVAGEADLVKIPMKLETPVLRALRRWETEFQSELIKVEKVIGETSFFPIHSEAIEKALDHLFQNAIESMSRQMDKSLRISLLDANDSILLTVTDNGCGIDAAILSQISDPFFTTKAHMARLGLGLTEAFGLLKQHHAIIAVSSQLGEGTTFEIRFDKQEAQRIIELSESRKNAAHLDGQILIPQDLPQPLEMQPDEEIQQVEQQAVDQEIEQLLGLSDLDFIEKPAAEVVQKTESESFLDENPNRGLDA